MADPERPRLRRALRASVKTRDLNRSSEENGARLEQASYPFRLESEKRILDYLGECRVDVEDVAGHLVDR